MDWREVGARIEALGRAPGGVVRTLAAALADHGMIYTVAPLPCGMRRVVLHSAKGMIGYFDAFEAWALVHRLEEGRA